MSKQQQNLSTVNHQSFSVTAALLFIHIHSPHILSLCVLVYKDISGV